MFEEYTKGLNKTENKQFQRVLELYPKLRPRYYQEVKAKIKEDKKISPKTQEKMLEFNDYIFESFFTSLGFIKEAGGFTIGDKVFADDEDEAKIISEFIVKEKDIFVVFEGDRSVIDSPKMTLDKISSVQELLNEDKKTSIVKQVLSKEKKLFQVGHSKASKYKVYVVSEGSIYLFIRPSAEWVFLDNAESRSLMSKIYSKGIVYCDDETIEKLAAKLPKSFLEMIQ